MKLPLPTMRHERFDPDLIVLTVVMVLLWVLSYLGTWFLLYVVSGGP